MDEYKQYYNLALHFLTFRPRSEKEIRDYLIKKNASETIIDKVVIQLKASKFLDDIVFAKLWIQQRNKYKPRSFYFIKMELKNKGIKDVDIEKALEEMNEDDTAETDVDRAKRLVEKKIGSYKLLPKREIYNKLGGYLSRKGFSYETIKKSIDAVLEEN